MYILGGAHHKPGVGGGLEPDHNFGSKNYRFLFLWADMGKGVSESVTKSCYASKINFRFVLTQLNSQLFNSSFISILLSTLFSTKIISLSVLFRPMWQLALGTTAASWITCLLLGWRFYLFQNSGYGDFHYSRLRYLLIPFFSLPILFSICKTLLHFHRSYRSTFS